MRGSYQLVGFPERGGIVERDEALGRIPGLLGGAITS